MIETNVICPINIETRQKPCMQYTAVPMSTKAYHPLTEILYMTRNLCPLFLTLIDNNKSHLDDQDKLLYLKSFLKRPVLTFIQDLTINSENYNVALKMIQSRFGDTQILVASYVDSLFKLKPVFDSKHASKLRTLYGTIEISIRNPKSLDI